MILIDNETQIQPSLEKHYGMISIEDEWKSIKEWRMSNKIYSNSLSKQYCLTKVRIHQKKKKRE